MNYSKFTPLVLAAGLLAAAPIDAGAQSRGHGGAVHGGAVHAGGAVRGGAVAVPRGYGGRVVYGGHAYPARVVGYAPYRPYYYGYRPGFSVGFYASFGYPYGYPYYGYPYYGGYYPYGAYGYPAYGYPVYGYPASGYPASGYPASGYPAPPAGYMSMQPGVSYGGVRIQGAPRDAQVFADGYYLGIVDEFDGPTQHLNLSAGVHKIEIRVPNAQPVEFDVNVQPGQTITYHAGMVQ